MQTLQINPKSKGHIAVIELRKNQTISVNSNKCTVRRKEKANHIEHVIKVIVTAVAPYSAVWEPCLQYWPDCLVATKQTCVGSRRTPFPKQGTRDMLTDHLRHSQITEQSPETVLGFDRLADEEPRERERRKLGGGSERHYRLEGGVTET
jgi:hypothetical protein